MSAGRIGWADNPCVFTCPHCGENRWKFWQHDCPSAAVAADAADAACNATSRPIPPLPPIQFPRY